MTERRTVFNWIAGVAGSVLAALIVWWLTTQSPFSGHDYKVSMQRLDEDKSGIVGYRTSVSIENVGDKAIHDFDLRFLINEADALIDTNIKMYWDEGACMPVASEDGDVPKERSYKCRLFNPGESLTFTVTVDLGLEYWQCYRPGQINVYLKAPGYSENQILEPEQRSYPLWLDC